MTRFQPATAVSNLIIRPQCPKCEAKTMLARIEPEKPGHETRTFECPECEYAVSVIAKVT